MSGVNTSWGAHEQNEKIISGLAWFIVVILLFYVSVFLYKTVFSSDEQLTELATPQVTSAVTPVPSGAGTVVKTPTFRVTPSPTPPTATKVATRVATSRPATPRVTRRPTRQVTPRSTPVVAATSMTRRYTLRVSGYETRAQADEACRTVSGLTAYNPRSRFEPANGRYVVHAGSFTEAMTAQVAMAALRTANPGLSVSVIPLVESSAVPPPPRVTRRVVSKPVPTLSTRRPTAVSRPPTSPPTRRVVVPTPSPTRRVVVPTPSPTRRVVVPTPTAVATRRPLVLGVDPFGRTSDLGPKGPPGFAVQLGSFNSKSNAVNFRQLLAGAGYDSYIEQVQSNGVAWYRVQIGAFERSADAKDLIAEVASRYETEAIVVRRP